LDEAARAVANPDDADPDLAHSLFPCHRALKRGNVVHASSDPQTVQKSGAS